MHESTQGRAPFNLVVLCLDTFREDFFSHRAPWPARIPNLDRLRARSVHFTQAFGDAQPTIPMRRAYFTGMRSFPWRFALDTKGLWPTGRGWHKIPPEQPTLAETLLGKGYQTGLISDTYHMFKATMNFTRGFTSYEFVRGNESDTYLGGLVTEEDLAPYVRTPDLVKHAALGQYLLNARERREESDWTTAQVFTRAAAWVKRQPTTHPFFLWVDSFGPHEPWDPPREYVEPYLGPERQPVKEFIYPVGMRAEEFEPGEIERVQHLYQGYVSFVDRWVGHFLDTLEASGHAERTIIMVVNDHGTELMDHGQFSKAASRLYTHNTQLIWSIAHPEVSARQCSALVQTHDLFPTALHLLGVKADVPCDGQNVWPWVLDQAEPVRRTHAITGWGGFASVRDAQWNYFVNFEKPTTEFLFNLTQDPSEMDNVALRYTEQGQRLRGLLEDFLGQSLPAHLTDRVEPGEAPFRVYYGSGIRQDKKDAGFV